MEPHKQRSPGSPNKRMKISKERSSERVTPDVVMHDEPKVLKTKTQSKWAIRSRGSVDTVSDTSGF